MQWVIDLVKHCHGQSAVVRLNTGGWRIRDECTLECDSERKQVTCETADGRDTCSIRLDPPGKDKLLTLAEYVLETQLLVGNFVCERTASAKTEQVRDKTISESITVSVPEDWPRHPAVLTHSVTGQSCRVPRVFPQLPRHESLMLGTFSALHTELVPMHKIDELATTFDVQDTKHTSVSTLMTKLFDVDKNAADGCICFHWSSRRIPLVWDTRQAVTRLSLKSDGKKSCSFAVKNLSAAQQVALMIIQAFTLVQPADCKQLERIGDTNQLGCVMSTSIQDTAKSTFCLWPPLDGRHAFPAFYRQYPIDTLLTMLAQQLETSMSEHPHVKVDAKNWQLILEIPECEPLTIQFSKQLTTLVTVSCDKHTVECRAAYESIVGACRKLTL